MRRLCLALAVVALLLLVTGVGTATASPPVFQDGGQLAASDQDAAAAAGTAQQEPSNDNSSVRVLSPGDDGPVSQTNEATSNATATNLNATQQTADQQAGGSGVQAIGQSATNDQDALALAFTAQQGASNVNAPVGVLSPGDRSSVTQTYPATSTATAGNLNVTKQTADQAQSGDSCKCGGDGTQLIGQSADNDQKAVALSETIQEKPSNTNISVRVLSPGDDGPVTQTNQASSDATAGNLNITKQDADQSQADGSGLQAIGQSADSDQKAIAGALTVQEKPSNTNISVRVLSPGDGGPVTQSNVASSDATAGNLNITDQDADQEQAGGSCKCKDGGTQLIGQHADSDQKAVALSATFQEKPSNTNTSVRVLSKGDDGDVEQENEASSTATAGNLNLTHQDADQTQAGGSGLQAIGQSAKNEQDAFALGLTVQKGASNENAPVRVLSKGDSGDVDQDNEASSTATAGNLNLTKQDADQMQDGGSCKCGHGTQLIGQSADSDQDATAIAATFQVKPSNTNKPVRVLSKGDDGDVEQENEASSTATAGNLNVTKQDADQAQGGSGLQVIGQSAKNEQDAFALGLTFQKGASNENAPVRVLSPGDGGPVSQANVASSDATAENINWTDQHATQSQGTGCCGFGIQAIGQLAKNRQSATALSATVQLGHRQPCVCKDKGAIGNSNEPKRTLSPGDDGPVRQSNLASSTALTSNWRLARQKAKIEATPCVCREPTVQAIGQLDENEQSGVAAAAGLQLHPTNEWAPDREKSPGGTGRLTQIGKKAVHDASGSFSMTDQTKSKVLR
jgi:hypothetical protein